MTRSSCLTSEKWFLESWVLFLTSSAYHPQTDGQSGQTSRKVDIALRFWLTNNSDADWVDYLPRLRGNLNNLLNSSTGLSEDEIIYGCRVRDTLSSLAQMISTMPTDTKMIRSANILS